jgi:hypothetical protein
VTTITHIGVWTRYANKNTGDAIRMIRHVADVTAFSSGFIAVLERPVSLEESSQMINAISKFLFVDNVGEYSDGCQLPW